MAEKSKIRSIRFTDELYDLIDRQTGDTFTQKLENLVYKSHWELPKKEQQLKDIQAQIELERQNLQRIRTARAKAEDSFRQLNYLIENCKASMERAARIMDNL